MIPSVSVLMPARDAADTVGEALASLRRQSLDDFEIVLVDDGSSDGTAKRAREAFGPDARLRVLEPGPVGLISALQHGLAACRAELVARMDADDIAATTRLEAQRRWLEQHPDVAVAGCLVECFPRERLGTGYLLYEQWINGLVHHDDILRELFIESPLAHPSVMYRRTAVLELGGYRDTGWPEDYDLWLRAARAGLRFGKVAEVLLRWRDHPERHSRRHERYAPDAFLRCKAHHLSRGPLAATREVVLWGAGPIGRRLARYLGLESVRVLAFVDIDPRKVGRSVRGAPVVAPEAVERFGGTLLLAAVGARGAREIIRARLRGIGWREGEHFLCAA